MVHSASLLGLASSFIATAALAAVVGSRWFPQSADSQPRPDDPIQQLIALENPTADDWVTEQRYAHTSGQLKRLGHVLRARAWDSKELAEIMAAGARATELRPAGGRALVTEVGGGYRVLMLAVDSAAVPPEARSPGGVDGAGSEAGRPRAATTAGVVDALRAMVEPMTGMPESSFTFKTTRVSAEPEAFSTEVRCEAFASGSGGVCQQRARWNVYWQPGPDASRPLIERIELLDFQEVSRDRLAFVECTTSVLEPVPGWREQLLPGGEYWFGRIDAVGEYNLMGHNGVAVGDVNGDGLDDVYVALGTGLPNKLLVQQADGTVRDMAFEAGVAWLDDTKGVAFADMDNDGDQDLLCALGPAVVLCKNDGTGKFDRFIRMRSGENSSFYSIALADYDLDGDLDIYAVRYVVLAYGVSVPVPFHDAENGPTNHLLRNDGDDQYVDVTNHVGLGVNNRRFSTSAAWADYDNDGDPDLFVTNDFGRNNLYRNDGGRFTDVAPQAGVAEPAAGMGVSFSDFDLDGDLDAYVSNMFSSAGRRVTYQERFQAGIPAAEKAGMQRMSWGNTLLVNQGDGRFVDGAAEAGVQVGRWAWGAVFRDLNNDGYEDIACPNGFLTGARQDDL